MRSDLPKIIAVDLDGTLFADAKQTILPQTFAVLSECIRLGCLLVPSTGRCELFVPFGLLPPVRYVIFCNGSMLIDRQTGSVLRTSPIKWQSVRKGWEAVRSLVREKHLIMQLFEEDGVVMEAHACEHPDAYSVPLPPFHRPYVQGNRIRRVASFDDTLTSDARACSKSTFPARASRKSLRSRNS